MTSVLWPAWGLYQRMRSCVRRARSSSVRGWNGADAATSSVEGWCGAHAPVEDLEEEHGGEPEQRAHEEAGRDVERDLRARRERGLDRGIEHRHVGLARAALHLVHVLAGERRFIGLLRRLDV